MPRYFVTLITTDESIGSNPGHHSGFVLSMQEHETAPLKSLGAYGYYGVPSSKRSGVRFCIKRQAGLDVDMVGNHGWLKREELYFLDRGHGVMGATHTLTAMQFFALQQEVERRLTGQPQVVQEWIEKQIKEGRPIKTKAFPRLYSEEEYSQEIYRSEKAKNGADCRLRAFEFANGITCHYQALSLLKEHVQDDSWIEKLGYNQKIKQSIPRTVEDVMAPVYLFSFGRFKPFRDGVAGLHRKGVLPDNRVYHCEQDPDTAIIWALPPEELLKELKYGCEEIKKAQDAISTLLGLYWLFADYDDAIKIENNTAVEGESSYMQLRQYINAIVSLFSKAELKQGLEKLSQLQADLRRVFLSDASEKYPELTRVNLGEHAVDFNILHNLPDKAKERFVALLGLRTDCQVESTCTGEYVRVADLHKAIQGLNKSALDTLTTNYLKQLSFDPVVDSSDDELYFSSEETETSSEAEVFEQKDSLAWNIAMERDGLVDLTEKHIAFKTRAGETASIISPSTLALFARGKLPSFDSRKTMESANALIEQAGALDRALNYHEEQHVRYTP